LGELFQQPENEIITNAIEKIQTKILGKFDAYTLLCKLDTLVKDTTPEHLIFTLPSVMIEKAMIILLISLCCWKKCCQSTPTLPYLLSSTPPAPLVFNMN
jgi:hypothetical protein